LFSRPDFKLNVSVYKLFFKWYAKNIRACWFGQYPTLNTMLHNIGLFKTAPNLSKEESRDT
jgi:hypothetical protein